VQDLAQKQANFLKQMSDNTTDSILRIRSDLENFTDSFQDQMKSLSEGQSFLANATTDFKQIKDNILEI
jgi:hypothetical protein